MTAPDGQGAPRRTGRPAITIDRAALVDGVERLFAVAGIDGVSIESAARELGVSRATLYRSIPTKQALLTLLFERMTDKLGAAARVATVDDGRDARARLHALMEVHIEAAIEMRHYLNVLFDGGLVRGDAYLRWRRWRRSYERIWLATVREACDAGVVHAEDPVVAMRLILGMCIWVSRWYGADPSLSPAEITRVAVQLIDREA